MQYFNKEFTNRYLRSHLSGTARPIVVHFLKNQVTGEVHMKIAKGTKHAIMTSNWMTVVQGANLVKGAIVMFWVRRSTFNGYKVVVDKLEPGAFGLGTKKHRRLLEAQGLL